MHSFTFAHLSDPHLPLRRSDLRAGAWLSAKRLSGALSWWRKRRHIHLPEILAQTISDIASSDVQHLVVTGDLINISAPAEYARAVTWLKGLGSPCDVTVVPGNHDRYVARGVDRSLDAWAPWMTSDQGGDTPASPAAAFPFLRVRNGVAFIGLSTAVETPIFNATGRLGGSQLDALAHLLGACADKNLCRIILLHHPPGSAGRSRRKGLSDRAAFLQVLQKHGAELILHGHTHIPVLDRVPGPTDTIPVIAPSSASSAKIRPALARWNEIRVDAVGTRQWRFDITAHVFDPQTAGFSPSGRFSLRAGQ